jgi:hypothetical protein
MLTSCASTLYPNWESVRIESCIHNKPCVSKGKIEACRDYRSSCSDWFKKRATKFDANTVVIDSAQVGRYYQCKAGLPANKAYKEHVFNGQEHSVYLKVGSNTVTGQAFLRQNGGGVVTCAGQSVMMLPDTLYFNQSNSDANQECESDEPGEKVAIKTAQSLYKTSQCDAQGNFEFNKVPAGNWIIRTSVDWNVYSVEAIRFPNRNIYYPVTNKQGGNLEKKITVQDGEVNKIIITN